MKHLNDYILEKLKIGKETLSIWQPKTKDELYDMVVKKIEGDEDADLNDIDTSLITDMSELFNKVISRTRNSVGKIDISEWDVSNVTNMHAMFRNCALFSCNLSKWDVSKVEDMSDMFNGCYKFKSDISKWDVSSVKNMSGAFYDTSMFDCDLSKWDVSNVENYSGAFAGSSNISRKHEPKFKQ